MHSNKFHSYSFICLLSLLTCRGGHLSMCELIKEGLCLQVINVAVFSSRKFLSKVLCFLARLKTVSVFHCLLLAVTVAATTTAVIIILRFTMCLYNLMAQVREFILRIPKYWIWKCSSNLVSSRSVDDSIFFSWSFHCMCYALLFCSFNSPLTAAIFCSQNFYLHMTSIHYSSFLYFFFCVIILYFFCIIILLFCIFQCMYLYGTSFRLFLSCVEIPKFLKRNLISLII